ncbi:MAG: hypothetical protein A2133_08045 [Actinobacteria bacterium RBG_16_64_13]|nr:MAG: hypothetical protein A2133_08045 [Actinobacteria bacterium RBG_16_64_13]
MDLDRREFLMAMGLAVVTPALFASAKRWRSVAGAAAPMVRPTPVADGIHLCARCGSPEHGALDPRCPQARESRADLQATARTRAAAGDGRAVGTPDVAGATWQEQGA